MAYSPIFKTTLNCRSGTTSLVEMSAEDRFELKKGWLLNSRIEVPKSDIELLTERVASLEALVASK